MSSTKKKIIITACVTVAIYVATALFVYLWKGTVFSGRWGERRKIIFIALEFLSLHFIFDIRKLYDAIFRFRYVVALAVLLFCTVNKYHGDCMGAYDLFVQPGEGDEFVQPIFGQYRTVRTDEWAITTPGVISSSYGEEPYGKYNNILRGGDTLNSVCGIYIGVTTLGKNFLNYGFAILPVENAYSFNQCGGIILTFMMSFEFCYIVGRKKRLAALTGAMLITCSSFFLWWGFPPILWSVLGALNAFYYFINVTKLRYRILCAIGFAVAFSTFVTNLYPAWQVPFGYTALALAIWIIIKNFSKIKEFKIKEYLIFVASLAMAGGLILLYLRGNKDYVETISQTVYPGVRECGGAFFLNKLFYYVQAVIYPYREMPLTSEFTAFISLFPMPFILGIICWVKNRKSQLFYLISFIVSIPMFIYVTTGMPIGLAKLLLFSTSTEYRLVDVLGFIGVLLLVRLLSEEEPIVKHERIMAGIMGALVVIPALYISHSAFSGYLNKKETLILGVLFFAIVAAAIMKEKKIYANIAMFGLIFMSLVTGITIRPLMKGFDAIWSKPVAKEISDIVEAEPDARWLVIDNSGFILPGYLVSLGAVCDNSNNNYPDMEMFNLLDPEGKYNAVYNRYCHLNVVLSEDDTWFELMAADSVCMHLDYEDMELLGTDYIFSDYAIEGGDDVELDCIYEENGSYIYAVNY